MPLTNGCQVFRTSRPRKKIAYNRQYVLRFTVANVGYPEYET